MITEAGSHYHVKCPLREHSKDEGSQVFSGELGQPGFIMLAAWEMHSDLCPATQQSLHKAQGTHPRGDAHSHKAGIVCLPGPPPVNQRAVRGDRQKDETQRLCYNLVFEGLNRPHSHTHLLGGPW